MKLKRLHFGGLDREGDYAADYLLSLAKAYRQCVNKELHLELFPVHIPTVVHLEGTRFVLQATHTRIYLLCGRVRLALLGMH